MTRKGWIAVGGAVALALVVVAWALTRRGAAPSGDAAADVAMNGDAGSMGGMEMGDQGMVALTPDQIRTFGITFGTAEVRPLGTTIRAVGLVDFDETRMAYVTPKVTGWVERLVVDFTGQPVTRGQPLLEIYSPELVSAQEELLLARELEETVRGSGVEGVAGGSADLVASAQRRLRYWDVSEAQIERLLRTGEVRKTLTLHAPMSGIVMEKSVFEGQRVEPGEELYMIADLSEVWIEAELFETDAALVHEGMPAEIEITALPGRTFHGRVEYVYPTLKEETRSMTARIALPNPGGRLKPGMYATVRLEKDLGRVLSVPRSAILRTGERAIAFVDMGGGRLMPHELRLGIAGEEYVEVLEGLEPGARVVTSAQYLLDSESNLVEVMRAMMAQMGAADVGRHAMPGMEGMDSAPGVRGMPGMEDTPGMEGMEGMDMDTTRVPGASRRP